MGKKIKTGMLCRFKVHTKQQWVGFIDDPRGEVQLIANNLARFGKRNVTVLKKVGASRSTHKAWTSYSQILGVDTNGNPMVAWVTSNALKPNYESFNSQSKD